MDGINVWWVAQCKARIECFFVGIFSSKPMQELLYKMLDKGPDVEYRARVLNVRLLPGVLHMRR
jgi:hypothetical protein